MSEALLPAPTGEEVLTSERCHISELLNHSRVADFSLARCRVEPGVSTQLHRLSVREYYVIASGEGLMEVANDAPFRVQAGDSVEIPAHAAQRIQNVGSEDLVFQCICLPRFTPDCYESLE